MRTHTHSLTHSEMHRSTHLIVFLRSWLWSRGLMESVVWVVDLFKLSPLSEALNVFYFGETCSSGLSLWHFSSFRAWVCFWWTERRERGKTVLITTRNEKPAFPPLERKMTIKRKRGHCQVKSRNLCLLFFLNVRGEINFDMTHTLI